MTSASFEINMLFYGQGPIPSATDEIRTFEDLHRRCMASISSSIDSRVSLLRVGLNGVGPTTERMVSRLSQRWPVCVYREAQDMRKYPMMRRMFHDPAVPRTADWAVWFDDDSYVVSPEWLDRLQTSIVQHPNAVMFGKKYFMHIGASKSAWIESASWYRGVPPATRKGKPKIDFMTGGWWALAGAVIDDLDWPDPRIGHNGGDVMLGAALWQQGHSMKTHHRAVAISKHKRRGLRERPAGG